MQTFLISTILGLLVATALAPAQAAAAETIRFSHDALTAFAFFSSSDPTGCILTEVSVIATDERRKEGAGPGEERSEALAAISRYDSCNDLLLIAAEGRAPIPPDAFQIDELTAATLNTAIELFDPISDSPLTVEIALTWEGVGDAHRVQNRLQIKSRAFTVNFRRDGTSRPAAASGAVSDGTTNFTPEPGVDNSLVKIKAGQLTIERN